MAAEGSGGRVSTLDDGGVGVKGGGIVSPSVRWAPNPSARADPPGAGRAPAATGAAVRRPLTQLERIRYSGLFDPVKIGRAFAPLPCRRSVLESSSLFSGFSKSTS